MLGEYDASGALFQETVWMGDIPIAALWPNGSGGVTVTYIHTDHLNTPRAITRTTDNAVLWRWRSDPFGTDQAEEDVDGDSVLARYYPRFPGQFYDVSSGLNYNYFRDYDSMTGKYVESDPIGLAGGLNSFAYTNGHPTGMADPNGLFRVYARQYYDGAWKYEFEFEPGCVLSLAEENAARPWRLLRRLMSAERAAFGDRFSGSNDVEGWRDRCTCRNYDPALEQHFRDRGYRPSTGLLGGGSTFSEAEARDVVNDLRDRMREERERTCSTNDCNHDEDLYPWNQLIDRARARGIPYIGNFVR